MAKPFASSADVAAKTETLEVLDDGVYALTAEGDPNVGAFEGEDFIVAVEAQHELPGHQEGVLANALAQTEVRMGVIAGSILSALAGMAVLSYAQRQRNEVQD